MAFIKGFNPALPVPEASLWFLFSGQKILVCEREGVFTLPAKADLDHRGITPMRSHYFGMLNDQPCFTGEVDPTADVDDGLVFKGVRSLFREIERELVMVVGLASQLMNWNRNHRFCGQCGQPTEDKEDERAKYCPQCGLVNYPRISPAIIVAVVKDGQILLAQSPRFSGGFYSVLAGFVEPGETLEECVHREVFEEVGITLRNISYFGSQPWPFPDSEMIAFTAEYEAGEIRPDESEIVDAAWFSPANLPQIPPRLSIARSLIDWYVEKYS